MKKALNGWPLFWIISVPMSIVMVIATTGVDLSTAPGVSHMIGFSVRWAVPFIFIVVAASSVQVLFPSEFSRWLLRNRKYLGLCFAVAMAWQGAFIFMMSTLFSDYYYEEVFYLRDELEGSTGYLFLAAMVVTSFRFGRKYLSQKQWKLLHKTGLYFLFAYPFSVYWWNLSYYPEPQPIDYVFYWGGFLAFTLRIAAWGKQRKGGASLPLKVLGVVCMVVGIVAASTGRSWQESATEFLLGPAWSANLVLWLPYWPFEPFFALFLIALGALFATKSRV